VFCSKCGKQIDGNATFCPGCGSAVGGSGGNNNNSASGGKDFNQAVSGFLNTPDSTNDFEYGDIEGNKTMALFAYIGILFLVPLLAAPNSKFARYHVNQGIILFLAEIAAWIVIGILTAITFGLGGLIGGLLNLAVLGYAVLGIVNAVNGKAKELPLIGKFRILK